MRIEDGKNYKVTKYTKDQCLNLGVLPAKDVKVVLKGYKFDEGFEMWFSNKGSVGYEVKAV